MNKFQKIAVQMAKDDAKKDCWKYDFKTFRNVYYRVLSDKKRYNIQKALGFKNWNKYYPF